MTSTDAEPESFDEPVQLRLTDDGGHAFARSGVLLVVVGDVFGLVNLQYWLVYREVLAVPHAWVPWLGGYVAIDRSFLNRKPLARFTKGGRKALADYLSAMAKLIDGSLGRRQFA